jgi:hypothetical protein
MSDNDSENRKAQVVSGWIGTPPDPQPENPPSHATKWYKIMGARHLLDNSEQ